VSKTVHGLLYHYIKRVSLFAVVFTVYKYDFKEYGTLLRLKKTLFCCVLFHSECNNEQ